jgi:hypothetical protein
MSRNIFALVTAALISWSTTSAPAFADVASETAAPLQASAQLPASAPLQSSAIAGSSVEAALPLADRVVVRKGERKLQLLRNGVALRTGSRSGCGRKVTSSSKATFVRRRARIG